MEEIEIFTDGGCRGNPGLGAYAAIMYRNGQPWMKYGDCYEQTTNNEMESSALLIALYFINAMNESGSKFKYVIYSDSAYSVNTFNDWIDGWISTGRIGWKSNKDIWEQVYDLKKKLQHDGVNVAVIKVKGHSGVPKNVEVDKLVNQLMDEHKHTKLMAKFPNLAYFEQNQLKSFSETESSVDVEKPLIELNRTFSVNNLYVEGDSVIAEVVGDNNINVVIPKTKLITLLNELGLERIKI